MQSDRPTPSELRERRKALSLSQGQCARIAGVTTRSWQRWEAGDQDIPPWTDMFLRGLECKIMRIQDYLPPPDFDLTMDEDMARRTQIAVDAWQRDNPSKIVERFDPKHGRKRKAQRSDSGKDVC